MSLQLDLVASCTAAILCVQQILLFFFDPHEVVLSLSGTDPGSLPEPTPADGRAAGRSGEHGVIWLSAGLLYVLFGLILVLLAAVGFRS